MPHLITENLPFTVRRGWTVDEFEKLFDAGLFAPDARLELIEGEVFEKMSQNEPHIRAIFLAQYKSMEIFGNGYLVGDSSSVDLERHQQARTRSLPLRGERYAIQMPCPRRPPNSSSKFPTRLCAPTRPPKPRFMRAPTIAEYWIVNLVDRTLEVRRQPSPMEGELLGHGYRSTQILLPGESIAPLGAPESIIGVDELLP